MKTITLSDGEFQVLNYFLDRLRNELPNNTCNELESEVETFFSDQEKIKIAQILSRMNCPSDPDGPDRFEWPVPDYCLLSYLQCRINSLN